MTTTKTRTGPHAIAWSWENRRDYLPVRADEVRVGDIYANHASVTESRPATAEDIKYGPPKINGRAVPLRDCWHVRVGEGFSTTTHRSRPVVVGRLR